MRRQLDPGIGKVDPYWLQYTKTIYHTDWVSTTYRTGKNSFRTEAFSNINFHSNNAKHWMLHGTLKTIWLSIYLKLYIPTLEDDT